MTFFFVFRACLDSLKKVFRLSVAFYLQSVEPMTDLALIAEASQKLTSLLDHVLAYVDDVLANRKAPDNTVGRALLDMVHSVPTMTPEQFEHMFNSNIKVRDVPSTYVSLKTPSWYLILLVNKGRRWFGLTVFKQITILIQRCTYTEVKLLYTRKSMSQIPKVTNILPELQK